MSDAKMLVKVLGWIYVVFGALGLLAGLGLIFGMGMLGASMPGMDVGFLGAMGAIAGIVAIVVAGFEIYVGLQLMKYVAWARIAGIVFGALSLLSIPIGTALGIFAIWLLVFNKEAIALFK